MTFMRVSKGDLEPLIYFGHPCFQSKARPIESLFLLFTDLLVFTTVLFFSRPWRLILDSSSSSKQDDLCQVVNLISLIISSSSTSVSFRYFIRFYNRSIDLLAQKKVVIECLMDFSIILCVSVTYV